MRKAIGIITVITAVIITVYYLTICGVRGNESALSTVGLEHHTIFILWGISTYIIHCPCNKYINCIFKNEIQILHYTAVSFRSRNGADVNVRF